MSPPLFSLEFTRFFLLCTSLTSVTAQAQLTKHLSRVNCLVLLLQALLAYVSPRIIW